MKQTSGGEIPPENEADFRKPDRSVALPYWVIVDTKGITQGLLHTCRSFEFCKDVIVSRKTYDATNLMLNNTRKS
jgi:hypothetical protein